MSITNLIKSIQDIMRQDAGVDGDAQRISQLVWMLFMKIFDDKELEREIEPHYQSPIPERLRWRNWAADEEGLTGDQLLEFINNDLFPTLKELEVGPDACQFRLLIVESPLQKSRTRFHGGRQLLTSLGRQWLRNGLIEVRFRSGHSLFNLLVRW